MKKNKIFKNYIRKRIESEKIPEYSNLFVQVKKYTNEKSMNIFFTNIAFHLCIYIFFISLTIFNFNYESHLSRRIAEFYKKPAIENSVQKGLIQIKDFLYQLKINFNKEV